MLKNVKWARKGWGSLVSSLTGEASGPEQPINLERTIWRTPSVLKEESTILRPRTLGRRKWCSVQKNSSSSLRFAFYYIFSPRKRVTHRRGWIKCRGGYFFHSGCKMSAAGCRSTDRDSKRVRTLSRVLRSATNHGRSSFGSPKRSRKTERAQLWTSSRLDLAKIWSSGG